MPNPTGRGGFGDHPELINPHGRETKATRDWKRWARNWTRKQREAIGERALTDANLAKFIAEQGHGRAAQSVDIREVPFETQIPKVAEVLKQFPEALAAVKAALKGLK